MSEASKRTLAWREQKRQDGYQPVTIWIPAKIKNAMVNLSFQRHQDLGELLVEAFQTWTPAKGGQPAQLVDMRRVQDLVEREVAKALASQSPTPASAPLALAEALPPGQKRCRKGHAYPASKKECPQCATLRKQKHRKNKAAARRGQVPA